MRKEKFEQEGKSFGIACGLAYQLTLMLIAQLGERFPGEGTVGHLTLVAAEPCFADLFRKLVIGIDRGQILRAPGPRIESRKHQERIKVSHFNSSQKTYAKKRPLAKGNGLCRT